jgi:hypothetical protein
MSQVHGVIGYFSEKEVEPGIWENQYTEKKFKGENLKIKRKIVENNKVTTDVVYEQTITFLGTRYIMDNRENIRYVTLGGVKWEVTNVDFIDYPRVTITIGGKYNANQ